MVLIDTSVWVEFFRGTGSKYNLILHRFIEEEEDICTTDIIITEILQGIRPDKDFKRIKNYILDFPIYSLKDTHSFVEAAQIYRFCRKQGLTIRKPLDCIIARVAIENNLVLCHNDGDFDKIAKAVKGLEIYKIPEL